MHAQIDKLRSAYSHFAPRNLITISSFLYNLSRIKKTVNVITHLNMGGSNDKKH